MFKKLIGTKAFYKRVFALMLPIMLQNAITNFVNMLDNVMVGQIGQVEMTGVAVANQLIFVFNLAIFGAISGAGIFTAQFYGKKDDDGIRHTFRFKVIVGTILTLIGIAALVFCGKTLVGLYLTGEGDAELIAGSLDKAYEYILIMVIGLLPYTLVQCFSSTLRETDKPILPMIAGTVAVLVNLALNYILIFGHFGAPKLGVSGAAIATVISRFVELIIILIYTYKNKHKNPFIIGAFRSLYIPKALVKQIAIKGLPLMANETFWAMGMATVNRAYSVIGYDVVSANNITSTFWQVFSVAFLSIGGAIGIVLGQDLGAGKLKEAKHSAYKLIALSTFIAGVVGILFMVCAEFIPELYNVDDNVKHLATRLMQIAAIAMPIDAFSHGSYFTLRSGGKTFITFLFDCGYVWLINVPIAICLSSFTSLSILIIYAIINFAAISKCFIGFYLVRKGIWVRNIVA